MNDSNRPFAAVPLAGRVLRAVLGALAIILLAVVCALWNAEAHGATLVRFNDGTRPGPGVAAGTMFYAVDPMTWSTILTSGNANKILCVNGTADGWTFCTVSLAGLANDTLSNLTNPTAINRDLLDGSPGAHSLGSLAGPWANAYADALYATGQAGAGFVHLRGQAGTEIDCAALAVTGVCLSSDSGNFRFSNALNTLVVYEASVLSPSTKYTQWVPPLANGYQFLGDGLMSLTPGALYRANLAGTGFEIVTPHGSGSQKYQLYMQGDGEYGTGAGPYWKLISASDIESGTLSALYGGTGFSTATSGCIVYASATNTLACGTLAAAGVAAAMHASTHKNGGSDEVASATSGANIIPKADSGGTLDIGFIPVVTPAKGGAGTSLAGIAKGGEVIGSAGGAFGISTACSDGQIRIFDSTQTNGVKCGNATGVSSSYTPGTAFAPVGSFYETNPGYISIANNSNLDATTALSIVMWVLVQGDASAANGLFEKSPLSGAGTCSVPFYALMQPNMALTFGLNATGGCYTPAGSVTYAGNTRFDPKDWHLLGFVYDKIAPKIYIDALLVATGGSYTANLSTSTDPLYIGIYNNSTAIGRDCHCAFDTLGFWKNHAVTGAEMLQLYNAGRGVTSDPTGTANAWIKFDDGLGATTRPRTAATVVDTTGNVTATITDGGSASWRTGIVSQ